MSANIQVFLNRANNYYRYVIDSLKKLHLAKIIVYLWGTKPRYL